MAPIVQSGTIGRSGGCGAPSRSRGSKSQLKEAGGYRTTIAETATSPVSSHIAPTPARGKGLLTPDKLLDEQVAAHWDEYGHVLAILLR
jgi:hypothetical protein